MTLTKEHRSLRRRPLFTPLVIAILGGLALGAVLLWVYTQATTSVVILVRHAETRAEQGVNPGLSEAGYARALALAELLKDTDIGAIVVSETARSRQTAEPLAQASGAELIELPGRDLAAIRAAIRSHDERIVLVIGHSNTLPDLVRGLSGESVSVGEDDYSGVYFVSDAMLSRARLTVLHY